MNFNSPVIIACDFANRKELTNFLKKFGNQKLFLKIGMELFYAAGIDLVNDLIKLGHQVFLDLKLHDIPHTVARALKVLLSCQPTFVTLHTWGGLEMLARAQEVVQSTKINLVGVTWLTSLDQKNLTTLGLNQKLITYSEKLMSLAKISQIEYVVCALAEVKEARSQGLKTIVPGVRLTKLANDQKRIATLEEVATIKPDFLVVGRAITQAHNPLVIYRKYLKGVNY